jgi:hypothetical protein
MVHFTFESAGSVSSPSKPVSITASTSSDVSSLSPPRVTALAMSPTESSCSLPSLATEPSIVGKNPAPRQPRSVRQAGRQPDGRRASGIRKPRASCGPTLRLRRGHRRRPRHRSERLLPQNALRWRRRPRPARGCAARRGPWPAGRALLGHEVLCSYLAFYATGLPFAHRQFGPSGSR